MMHIIWTISGHLQSQKTFERWLCYLNICISILIIAFVTVPEMLIGAKAEEKAYKATFSCSDSYLELKRTVGFRFCCVLNG